MRCCYGGVGGGCHRGRVILLQLLSFALSVAVDAAVAVAASLFAVVFVVVLSVVRLFAVIQPTLAVVLHVVVLDGGAGSGAGCCCLWSCWPELYRQAVVDAAGEAGVRTWTVATYCVSSWCLLCSSEKPCDSQQPCLPQ